MPIPWERFILAPDSFKGSLTSPRICQIVARELEAFFPGAEVVKIPMADGGEGTVHALVTATRGKMHTKKVTGPLGAPVKAFWGILGDKKTAVIEMAAASGLELVPLEKRNPLYTTTFGTGELIASALDKGCKTIIVGIGGSATNDGGAGMAQALGARLLDKNGEEIGFGGKFLLNLNSIDVNGIHPGIKEAEVIVACDVNNPLCGPEGASFVYGPQKGASPNMAALLDKALTHYASVIKKELHLDISRSPGAGAAGGLGGGLMAFLNGKLRPGVEIVLEYSSLAEALSKKGKALVLTGEGEINNQTIRGKVPWGVARAAKKHNLPVIALVGSKGPGADNIYEHGIDAILPILASPMPLEEALTGAEENLQGAARLLCRLLQISL